ncbi:hypothetical protein TYRP_009698 [Tyrophagus putrescentiae]|nr:hypothetical protein TYRP_009698 [Tyrophagus putrescentiae]
MSAVTTVDSITRADDPLNEIELPEEDIAEEWIHASDVAASSDNQQLQQQQKQQQSTTSVSSSSSSSVSSFPSSFSTSSLLPFEPFLEHSLTAISPTDSEGERAVKSSSKNGTSIETTFSR